MVPLVLWLKKPRERDREKKNERQQKKKKQVQTKQIRIVFRGFSRDPYQASYNISQREPALIFTNANW